MPKKKEYVSVSNGVHKKNFAACKGLCNLQELYIAFKKKTPKCKYWVLKDLCLEAQILCPGWLKNDSLDLRLKRSSKCCVASPSNELGFDIQRPDPEQHSGATNALFIGVHPVLAQQL